MPHSRHPVDRPVRRTLLKGMIAAATPGLASVAPRLARAQAGYPDKPIRLVTPYAPGGAADTVARIITPRLSAVLGQQVIVDNRAGASGAIGSQAVALAPPDGYTLLINLGPPHQTVQYFSKSVKYDPVNDFTPIAMVAVAPQAVVVPATSSLKTIADLVAAAKAAPSGLSYATSGIGTSQHLAGLLLAQAQNIKLTHVGYRGGAPALTDVVGGQVDCGILVLSNSLPFIRSGKLRALGVVEGHRAKSAPDIPTLAEGGLTGFSVPDTWAGLLGPKNLPADVMARLSAAVPQVMKDPTVVAALVEAGYDPVDLNGRQFGEQLAKGTEIYRTIVNKAGIQPE